MASEESPQPHHRHSEQIMNTLPCLLGVFSYLKEFAHLGTFIVGVSSDFDVRIKLTHMHKSEINYRIGFSSRAFDVENRKKRNTMFDPFLVLTRWTARYSQRCAVMST